MRKKLIHLPYLIYFQMWKRRTFLFAISLVYQLEFLISNKKGLDHKRNLLEGAAQRFMKGGEHPWQKNWQEPRELCLGPQGSCCRLLSGKGLLDLCCCVWPTSSLSFLPCVTCLCFREKCLCAPPGTGRIRGQPVGSSGGKWSPEITLLPTLYRGER